MNLPMKFHIDRLYDYLTTFASGDSEPAITELLGVLYEIGSQWNYYKQFFESYEPD